MLRAALCLSLVVAATGLHSHASVPEPSNTSPLAKLHWTDGQASIAPGLGRATGTVQKYPAPDAGAKLFEASPNADPKLAGNSVSGVEEPASAFSEDCVIVCRRSALSVVGAGALSGRLNTGCSGRAVEVNGFARDGPPQLVAPLARTRAHTHTHIRSTHLTIVPPPPFSLSPPPIWFYPARVLDYSSRTFRPYPEPPFLKASNEFVTVNTNYDNLLGNHRGELIKAEAREESNALENMKSLLDGRRKKACADCKNKVRGAERAKGGEGASVGEGERS
jgi:hypothetical protein